MSAKKDRTILKAGGREVSLSNLDKLFYPRAGFTKGDVIQYYSDIAPVLLPHLKGKPVSLKRYPDGVEGKFFYEKQCPSHAPDWVKDKTVPVEKEDCGIIDYCVIDDLPSLIWAANIANLELHTFQHRGTALQRPLCLVFDLDPGPPAGIVQCCEVALHLQAMFDGLGLQSFPKTSGSKGMQLVVPLNTPVSYDKTKLFAHAVADALAEEMPELVVSDMSRAIRKRKVFIDWSQNDDKKTTVSAYSLRAKDEPTVSTPLQWSEVKGALKAAGANEKKSSHTALSFTAKDVLVRVKKWGDLFEPVLKLKQKLPKLQ